MLFELMKCPLKNISQEHANIAGGPNHTFVVKFKHVVLEKFTKRFVACHHVEQGGLHVKIELPLVGEVCSNNGFVLILFTPSFATCITPSEPFVVVRNLGIPPLSNGSIFNRTGGPRQFEAAIG